MKEQKGGEVEKENARRHRITQIVKYYRYQRNWERFSNLSRG